MEHMREALKKLNVLGQMRSSMGLLDGGADQRWAWQGK
jgi:hypothetical protein